MADQSANRTGDAIQLHRSPTAASREQHCRPGAPLLPGTRRCSRRRGSAASRDKQRCGLLQPRTLVGTRLRVRPPVRHHRCRVDPWGSASRPEPPTWRPRLPLRASREEAAAALDAGRLNLALAAQPPPPTRGARCARERGQWSTGAWWSSAVRPLCRAALTGSQRSRGRWLIDAQRPSRTPLSVVGFGAFSHRIHLASDPLKW